MANPLGRIPIIALEYSEADKAVPKEVMIDYDTGNIYVVNRDGTVIFDITSKVRELIESGEIGSNMLVTVEGVGHVQLNTYLGWLHANMLTSTPIGCPHQTIKRMQTDLSSVTVKNNVLQMYKFDEALDNTVPVKLDGEIKWVSAPDLANGEVVEPQPPVVNNAGTVTTIELNADGKIVLTTDAYQRSTTYTSGFSVVVPTSTEHQYTKIAWNYITSVDNPEITFSGNIVWEGGLFSTAPDSVHVFEFETWDYGVTWFAKRTVYGRAASTDPVTVQYLEETTYSKNQIADFLAWKTQTM